MGVQACADPRRRVRAPAEGPPRRPPRALRRLDRRAAGRQRGVRRDPRLPPRAGVPARARGGPDRRCRRRSSARSSALDAPARRRSSARACARPTGSTRARSTLVPDGDLAAALALRLRRANTHVGLGELRLASDELRSVADGARDLDLDPISVRGTRLARQRGAGSRAARRRRRRLSPRPKNSPGGSATAGSRSGRRSSRRGRRTGSPARSTGRPASCASRSSSSTGEGDVALEIQGLLRLAMMLMNAAQLDEGEEALQRCVDLAASLGSVRDAARAEHMLGMIRLLPRRSEGGRGVPGAGAGLARAHRRRPLPDPEPPRAQPAALARGRTWPTPRSTCARRIRSRSSTAATSRRRSAACSS